MIQIDTDSLAKAIAAQLLVHMKTATQDPWLGEKKAAEHMGLSVSTFKRYRMKEGFPMPERPPGGRPKWRRSELDAWMHGK